MKYRNVKTGATFETVCVCTGKDWEVVEEATPVKPVTEDAPAKVAPKRKKETKKDV